MPTGQGWLRLVGLLSVQGPQRLQQMEIVRVLLYRLCTSSAAAASSPGPLRMWTGVKPPPVKKIACWVAVQDHCEER